MAAVSDDDDIVAGPQKMSLKCPVSRTVFRSLQPVLIQLEIQLSYMRISTPCRSVLCVHSQCFDATSWFSVMEQTTTYMCPVCEKVLNHDDLIVDGCVNFFVKVVELDISHTMMLIVTLIIS